MSVLKSISKYYPSRIVSFVVGAVLLCIIMISEKVQSGLLGSIKKILDFEPLYHIIIGCSLLVGIYSSIYWVRSKTQKNLFLLFKVFGPLFDPPANCLAYGLVIASVLKLVKGLFNQQFFEVEYFRDFGLLNISAIGLACIPLLIWSVNGLVVLSDQIFKKERDMVGEVDLISNQSEVNVNEQSK